MTWLTAKLGDLAEVITKGTTPRTLGKGYVNFGIPFLRAENLQGDEIVLDKSTLFIDEETDKILARSRIHPGDVLLSIAGTIGRAAIVTEDSPQMNCNQAVAIIRITRHINSKFLLYWFKTAQAQSHMYGAKVTLTISNLSLGQIKQLQVPLPSISEQRRIVEILDQADALRKMRAEADVKAERILPALFIKMFGDPSNWTSSTNTKPLDSLVNVQSGGTPSKQNVDYWNGNIPWVSPKDMKKDIILDSIDHISERAIQETNVKYIEPGAVLIVVRGMILAHTIPIALAGEKLTINQDMKALMPKCNDIDSTYLYAALKASSRKMLSQVGTAAHGTRKIETDELLKLPILIPSQEKLQQFSSALAEFRFILSGINKTKEQIEKLFDTLLQRAFSGELTAKWREAHMKELLAEMEEQTKALQVTGSVKYKELTLLEEQ